MKKLLPFAVLFLLAIQSQAQYLTGLSSYYDDSFIEWQFYAEDEQGDEDEGELKITWQLRENDFTEWDYRMGDTFGTIKMNWQENPEEW